MQNFTTTNATQNRNVLLLNLKLKNKQTNKKQTNKKNIHKQREKLPRPWRMMDSWDIYGGQQTKELSTIPCQ